MSNWPFAFSLQFQCVQIFLTYIQTNVFVIVSLVNGGTAVWYTGELLKLAPSGFASVPVLCHSVFRVSCLGSISGKMIINFFSCQRNCVIL